jgi:CRISPR type I-E-associated protein CasB/Cse2
MNQEQAPAHGQLIKHLRALKAGDDRGSLARLRRGSADPLGDPDVVRIVGRDIPPATTDTVVDIYLITACLFALNPKHVESGLSLGRSVRQLQWQFIKLGQKNGSPSVEARFRGLLEAPREELPVRLRHIFQMLGDKEIWVDYSKLLTDLMEWEALDRHIQRQWARDFWRPSKSRQPDSPDANDGDDENTAETENEN